MIDRLSRFQQHHPWRVLAVALLSAALGGWLAGELTLKTSFGELLPQNKESVIVAERVGKRLPSQSTLTVVIDGDDDEALTSFADALAEELRKLPPELVSRVETGAADARAFFDENRLLYADLALIEQVHAEIEARYAYEVNKAAGFLLDEDEPPPPITEETIKKRLEGHRGAPSGGSRNPFPDYYLDSEAHIIALLVRTPLQSGDLDGTRALRQRVEQAVADVTAQRGSAGTVGITGNLITSAETHEQIKGDLEHVGLWGVSLVLGVVFLYYLRIRTLLAMMLTAGIGVAWTFGAAYLLIGHLNSSTGFLFSIVVGNGINFSIIYMSRYLEARRSQDAATSALTAHRETWLPTLTAAGAACTAYGSLVVTDFRGFKHFGVIGGSGMLLCWLATYAFLPSILAISERAAPITERLSDPIRAWYGRPFAWLVDKAPAGVIVVAVAITAVSIYLARGFIAEPMEYDMTQIANAPDDKPSEARRLMGTVDKIVGRQGQDGLAIVTDRLDQVKPLAAELEALAASAPPGKKPFEKVVTIYSALPSDQDKKIELIEATLARVRKARDRGFISDADWQKLEPLLPDGELRPIDIDDLPDGVKRSFVEKDGTLGRLVYIVPTKDRSIWDGRYLIEFADSFRSTTLPDGSVVKGSGSQVVYADMLLTVVEDAPVAIAVSLAATLLIIALAFRFHPAGIWVIAAVAIGMSWMIAVLAVWNSEWRALGSDSFQVRALKLNFLNFVALPITIGVGADYAVNVVQRHRILSRGGTTTEEDVRRVVVETGGAVILCSLTTILGYSALTLSVNKAINSFGIAAAAGEICCLLTGVVVLPAAMMLWARRKR